MNQLTIIRMPKIVLIWDIRVYKEFTQFQEDETMVFLPLLGLEC